MDCNVLKMVPLWSARPVPIRGALQVKKKKKKIEITIAVFVYHTKVRNQIHCNNSWKVPVQQVGGTGMSWRWDGEWGGFSH